MDMPLKQLVCTVITVLFMFTLIGVIKNNDVFTNIPASAHTKAADYNSYNNDYIKKDSKFKYENMVYKDNAMPENNFAAIPVIMPEPTPAGTNIPPGNNPAASETSKISYVVSKKEREYDGKSAYIDIRTVFQLPELPVGCEATALTMVLRFYGFDADKTDIAGNYLPKSEFSRTENEKVYINSYFDFFLGDPFGWGYGCFSNCIAKTAENYISANGGGYDVKNISGVKPGELYEYVSEGIPVICWGTTEMSEPFYSQEFYDIKTGEDITWIAKEHCFVLAGFDDTLKTVTINDPQKGIVSYDMELFEKRYRQLHSQAVVITPEETRVITTETTETVTETESLTQQETTAAETAPTKETEKTKHVEATAVKPVITTSVVKNN